MKPTRICNWPPRLDVALPPDLRDHRRPRHPRRPPRRVHPALHAVARERWRGRVAEQRRFEAPPVKATTQLPVR
jgi:hypothetical protein